MNMRNLALLGVVLLLLFAFVTVMQGNTAAQNSSEISYSEFLQRAENGEIKTAEFKGNQISGTDTNEAPYVTHMPPIEFNLGEKLAQDYSVDVSSEPVNRGGGILGYLGSFLPFILIIAFWFFISRQMQGGGGRGAMSFGKSKARLLTERQGRVTFDDVAGVDEAKEELQEIVEFLQEPGKFQRLGGKIPKGALLVGPPGTGKTLIARAVAGEANVPFFTISGSDFVEMFVGVGASRVRDMFEQAKKNAPCIIFIDEIDAVGRSRGAGMGGGNDEREQTLNQLLVEMDGFEANEGIIIIAATNRPDVLDPALLRPGRFDRQVNVGNPDIIGREKILKVHMRNVPVGKDVEAKVIARGTPGFSGADLANLVNEAALLAARRGKRVVAMREFEDAKDKVMMGPERKSMVMSEKEKILTAFHEAGHAIVAMNVPESDPVHKATIIPRGRALGMVMRLPEEDKLSENFTQMTSFLAIAMGGRVAEELKFGKDKITSGASSDIQQATRLARAMITRWGFSDKIGTIDYSDDTGGNTFLGQQIGSSSSISSGTAKLIEEEVRRLIDEANETARKILTEKNADWIALSEGLLEYETLSGKEIDELIKGNPPERPDDFDAGPTSAVPVVKPKKKPDGSVGGTEPEGT